MEESAQAFFLLFLNDSMSMARDYMMAMGDAQMTPRHLLEAMKLQAMYQLNMFDVQCRLGQFLLEIRGEGGEPIADPPPEPHILECVELAHQLWPQWQPSTEVEWSVKQTVDEVEAWVNG